MADETATKSEPEPAPESPVIEPSEEKPTPASTGFTLEQIKAWADKPVTPEPPPVQYSLDQVRQWAARGTGPLEPSPLLKQEPGVAGFLFPELQTNIGRVVAQSGLRAGLDAAAGLLGLGGTATEAARGLLTPESVFKGRSVADVQAERDRLQGEVDRSNAQTDQQAATGKLSGEDIMGATIYEQGLRARIAAADKYIAAGGKVQEGAFSQSLEEFSKGFRTVQARVQGLEAGIPSVTGEVPAQFAQSQLGTGAAIVGQIAATLPLMAADPAAATAVFAGQGFQGFYRDAKDHGADDRTATTSGLIGASLAPLQTGMLDVPTGAAVDMLSKLLGGQSSKTIMAEVIGSLTRGGVVMGGTQFTQNLTARIQGYDPNRPLDEDVVRQAIFGSALDTIASVTRQFARRRGEAPERPSSQTETRNAPPPPPVAPPQSEGDVIDRASRDFDKIMPEVGTPEEALRGQPETPTEPIAAPARKSIQLDSGKVVTPEAVGAEGQRPQGIIEEGTTVLAGGDVLRTTENKADRRYTYHDGKGNVYSGLTWGEANDLHRKLNPRIAERAQETVKAPVKTQQQIMMEAAQGLTETPTAITQGVPAQGVVPAAPVEVTTTTQEAPYGRHEDGTPFTADEWHQREHGMGEGDVNAFVGLAQKIKADPNYQPTTEERSLLDNWMRSPGEAHGNLAARAGLSTEERWALEDRVRQLTDQLGGRTLGREISPTAVAEAVRPEQFAALSPVQKNVVGELVRRGMPTDEALERVSRTRAPDFQGILNEALSIAVRPPQFARLVGPGIQPTIPAEVLSQADARAIVNRAAESAGVEGKILYAPNVDALPRRIRQDVLGSGQAQGAQTIWDHRDGQLWVIGDAFGSAAELHRTLIEEAIPRIFDHGQNPIAMTHDPEDPRLGWWDPVGQQAVINTANLTDRADPMADASKTAIHESVWHAGVDKLFTNTPQGVAAYNDTMDRVRARFDSTGESQQLAISRGFESVDAMSKAYGELYGLSGDDLRRVVTEELIGVYAEEHFPTRASLEQSPRWYQDALGRLGSAIRREFGWKISDWDVQQLVRDSYGASRLGKTSTGVGSVPVRAEAIHPGGHAIAVMDNRSVTDPGQANIGQLETGHPLTEAQMEVLYNRLEGAGHPIGIMSRPEGPILVNYNERALPNETFQALAGRAVSEVLGPGHSIQFARNEGTYASNDPITIRTSRTPDAIAALQTGRQLGEPTGIGGARELLPAAQRLGEPGRPPASPPVRQPIGPARASSAEPLRDRQARGGGPTSAADVYAANARRGTPVAETPRATFERASLRGAGEGGGSPPEPRPDSERGTEDERIARQRAATAAGLGAQEGLRQFGAQQAAGRVPGATFSERLAANTREGGAVYGVRPRELVQAEGRAKFTELGSDPTAAIEYLRNNSEYAKTDSGTALSIAASDALRARETSLRESGNTTEADRVQAQIQQFNSEVAERSTIKAQALSAEQLRYQNGDSAWGRTQRGFNKTQGKRLGTEPVVDEVQKQVADMRNDLVRQAIEKLSAMFEKAQRRVNVVRDQRAGESLADRYIRYRSELINSWGARQGAAPAERAILDEAFGRFARTVREKIQEQVSLPKLAPPETMTVGQRIQESLRNWPMLDRLWKASLDQLKGDNPNSLFFSRLPEEMGAPISDAQVRSVLGELKGVDIRSLAQQALGVRDRIGDSISERLTRDVGLSSDQAVAVERHITDAINRLVSDSQRTQLEALLAKLGRNRQLTAPRRQTELDSMMRMLNLGAFDKEHYYNAISERFGLPSWNQETVDGIRSAGDRLQEIQAERGPHELAEQYQAQIADLLMRAQPKLSRREAQFRALWYASLLTGPTTHIPYFMANGVKAMIDLTMRNLDGFAKGQLTPEDILRTYGVAARQLVDSTNWSEFRETLATGYRQHRPGAIPEAGIDVYGMRSLGTLPHRGGLEALPLPGGRSNPLNWFKYVPRALEAINGLFYRSANEAIMRNIALRESQDRYPNDPTQAKRWANEVIFGSEQTQAEAQERASREALTYNWTEAQQRRRVEELIRESRPAELNEEAHRFALHAFYRETPIGDIGSMARWVQDRQRQKGGMFWTISVPFTNIAGNVANEALNWTPWGWRRGADIQGLYENVPGMHPERWGPRERAALQAEYYWKANIGATLVGGLGAYLVSQLSNPNPYFNIHGAGPSDQNEKNTWLATGAKPFTIKFGDRYFRYADWPIAIVLGALGQMGDVLRYDEPRKVAKGNEVNYAVDAGMALLSGGARVLTDHSFLQSVSAIFQLLSAQGTQQESQVQNYIANLIASFERIPLGGTGAEQIYRMFDPSSYETKSAAGKLFSQVPFAARAANLEPKVNVFGEPIDNNSLYRILGYPGRPEPVYSFLAQHNIGMSIPQFGKILYPGTSTPLDMAQYQRYLQERGQSFKAQLSDRLEELSALKPDELKSEIESMQREATNHAEDVISETYPEPKE